jgi:CheY-like chemotaxis protein
MIGSDIVHSIGRRTHLLEGDRATGPDRRRVSPLTDRCVLVVEDEFLIADDIGSAFAQLGITVVGPASTVERGLQLAVSSRQLDGAVLDINMRGEMIFPVADALKERGVPFIFTTGYDTEAIPERYRAVARCEKPLDMVEVVEAIPWPQQPFIY